MRRSLVSKLSLYIVVNVLYNLAGAGIFMALEQRKEHNHDLVREFRVLCTVY